MLEQGVRLSDRCHQTELYINQEVVVALISFKFNPFKSLTVAGTLAVVASLLWSHFDPTAVEGTLGPLLVQVIGILLGMFGIRNAIAKNGTGA